MQEEMKLLYGQLSHKVLSAAFAVHNELGPGLLERCYQDAYSLELLAAGVAFERQKKYRLIYKEVYIGDYIADLVVDDKIILELKSVAELHPLMDAQTINYLRLSKCKVGYLMNFFGSRIIWKRFIL